MSNREKPEKHQLMSVGRVAMEHPWYDADDVDKILDEQAKTIERLRKALRRERHELPHDRGCDCDLCVAIDTELAGE